MKLPAPNQTRWMAERATLLALIAGAGVALVFGGSSLGPNTNLVRAFAIGLLAGATSFAVSMLIFMLAWGRLSPQVTVFVALTLGGLAAYTVGVLIQGVLGPN